MKVIATFSLIIFLSLSVNVLAANPHPRDCPQETILALDAVASSFSCVVSLSKYKLSGGHGRYSKYLDVEDEQYCHQVVTANKLDEDGNGCLKIFSGFINVMGQCSADLAYSTMPDILLNSHQLRACETHIKAITSYLNDLEDC